MISKIIIDNFLKDVTSNRKKTNRTIGFWIRNKHILKRSVNIYKSSRSSFSKTPQKYNQEQRSLESRLVVTFLTIMRVTVILCSFRLVLEGKAGTETSESSLEFSKKMQNPPSYDH